MIAEIRVGKGRTIVIPKAIAEALKIGEGSRLRVEVKDDSIILKVVPDAIWLSVHSKKLAKITLKELEAESVEVQEKYVK